MRIITGSRKTGRTTLLIQLCAESEAKGEVSYIVCHAHQEAYRIARKAKEMGLDIRYPITYDDFLQNRYAGSNIQQFFIDNADMLLQGLTHVPISAIIMPKTDV